MLWQDLLLFAYDHCVLDCEHSSRSRFGRCFYHLFSALILMIRVQFIRPPSIIIGSPVPSSGDAVSQFGTSSAESVITRSTFVDFSYYQRNKYRASSGHFVRKIF